MLRLFEVQDIKMEHFRVVTEVTLDSEYNLMHPYGSPLECQSARFHRFHIVVPIFIKKKL